MFDKLIFWIIALPTLLLPWFFLPVTQDFFDTNKLALFVLTIAAATIIWSLRHVVARNVRLTLTPPLLPLALLTLVSIVSVLVAAPNKILGLTGFPVLMLALLLFYLIFTSRVTQAKQVTHLLSLLKVSALVLALIRLASAANLFALLPQAPDWLKAPAFTPAGLPLNLILFLIPIAAISLASVFSGHHIFSQRLTSAVFTAIIGTAAVITAIYSFNHPQSVILLPFSTSWEIATENLKAIPTALVGSGPDNFVDAFTRNHSASFNANPWWNLRFATSRNFPMHLLTTMGLFGLFAYLLLLWSIIITLKSAFTAPTRHQAELPLLVGLALAAILTLLFPPSLLTWWLLILLLGLAQALRKLEADTTTKDVFIKLFAVSVAKPDQVDPSTSKEEILPFLIGLPTALLALVGIIMFTTTVYTAEITFNQSLIAASRNRGTDTYNLQIKAIRQFPHSDRYRTAYALTNLSLASAISNRPEISQADRENITQLIQQSIREAKFATTINPGRTANWETLAVIYRNLINVAQGSQDWALAALAEAIKTDPQNPRLRLELGGIYYGLNDFDPALKYFDQAVSLKPDWPNAHYNVSAAYRQKGELDKAIQSMDTVLAILDPEAADYAKAQTELQALKDQLDEALPSTPSAETELIAPSPLPSPDPNRTFPLPSDSGL